MVDQIVLELRIRGLDEKTLSSLYYSLKPDTIDLPVDCSVEISRSCDELTLYIRCRRVNDLRALFNSFFNIISTILHVKEEVIE